MQHYQTLARPLATAALAAGGAEFGRKDGNRGGGDDSVVELARKLKSAIEGVKEFDGEVRARMDALEQKLARRGSSGVDAVKASIGRQFADADEVQTFLKSAASGHRGSVSHEIKATITSATTDANGSAGDLMVPARDAVYIPPQRRLTVRNLLPVVQISSGAVEIVKRTGFTNNAATVAEGTTKPSSELKYDKVTITARTIAHWVLASRQILEDAPQLSGLIDTDLLYGLAYIEDLQLLSGSGTGEDLHGIYTQATPFALPPGFTTDGPTKLDVIGAALLQNALAGHPATGVVMHPSDWMDIRMTKNADGEYLLGPPGADVQPRLFGKPVVETEAMTVDKFLVGNFNAATLYDRWQARVEVSTEDSDNFRKNLVTVLAEERIGLAVKDTTAFTKGDFSDAIAELDPA